MEYLFCSSGERSFRPRFGNLFGDRTRTFSIVLKSTPSVVSLTVEEGGVLEGNVSRWDPVFGLGREDGTEES